MGMLLATTTATALLLFGCGEKKAVRTSEDEAGLTCENACTRMMKLGLTMAEELKREGANVQTGDKSKATSRCVDSCSAGNFDVACIAVIEDAMDATLCMKLPDETLDLNLVRLHLAAENDDIKTARRLLDKHVSPDGVHQGETSLRRAATAGSLNVAKLLVARGANVNAVKIGGNDDYSALQNAVLYDHREVVKLLVGSGADLAYQSRDGQTALSVAEGNPDLQELVRGGK